MVLGSRTNNRRSPTLQRDFLINIQEIKPWPPSQSLRTLRSVLIQWEHGEKYSGSTNTVIPLLGSGIGDGKIEFNESFKISITLVRDIGKGGDNATFQKSILELNLYEPRRDKTAKGQLLGTAIVDFAEYGVVKKAQNISVPINSKRIYNNASKPLIFLRIQSIERGRTSSSSRESLSRVLSMERNGGESVSALMNEEYAEEAETASVTDDDVSSISSMTLSNSAHETSGGLSPQTNEVMNDIPSEVQNLIPTQQLVQGETKQVEEIHEKENVKDDNGALFASETGIGSLNGSEDNTTIFSDHETKSVDNITDNGHLNIIGENKFQENEYDGEALSEGENSNNNEKSKEFSKDDNMGQESCPSDAITPSEEKLEFNNSTIPFNKLNHVKSVRSSIESRKSNGSIRIGKLENDYNSPLGFTSHGKKESKIYTKETNNTYSDGKVLQLERRIKMLEGELREAAGIEVGLYSIVAEHGSSTNKVHAPARRLSRLYLYACKDSSTSRRESAARSAVSGLVVVSKACGNDVPRLTYWLSNTVVLRAIIQQQLPLYAGSSVKQPNGGNCIHKKVSPLKWKESSKFVSQNFDDWKDPRTFTSALEKIEGWIFSRAIESIWWQTLTPHMQSAATKAINTDIALAESNSYRRTFSSGDQDHVDISLELWKKAFKDACERLCPVRGGGHECGCLPVLARLIMEQCVARLDVAMFNAILRESDDEIPTDPISDPISDAKVLPIPAGKASFGAGAQLKNAIGNWSRWLTDLFGIDDDSHRESNIEDQDDKSDDGDHDTSSNSFHLLNALSDLMMLPKDMLLNQSIRKEVCPTFGAPLIKRVLSYFVPDEFCPDLIPEAVIESLNSEDHLEEEEDFVKAFPCNADQIVYTPPKSTSLFSVIGEIGNEYRLKRSGSSVLKKSYTSDDELDELDSPMSSIINGFQGSMSPIRSNESGSSVAVRYQLLREVWLSSE